MKVILGNPNPTDAPGPAVTYSHVMDDKDEDGSFRVGYLVGSDAADIKDHLFDNPGLVTHLPGQGAVLNVIRTWNDHGNVKPSWVSVEPEGRSDEEAADFERFLSEFWRIPRGIPADLEDTHHTLAGPPGVGPSEGE